MAGWRQEWWAVQLRKVADFGGPVWSAVTIDPAACEAALKYIDELQSGEPEAMSFDAWCDRMAVLPSLSIDDVEEILAEADGDVHPIGPVETGLMVWLAEAKTKETT